MRARITVATKLNCILIGLALLAGSSVFGWLLYKEYLRLDQELLDRSRAALQLSATAQQYALYYQNKEGLNRILQQLTPLPELTYAGFYGTNGQPVAEWYRLATESSGLPAFSRVREHQDVLETASYSYTHPEHQTRYLDLTVPIFSPINPFYSDVDPSRFVLSLAQPKERGSQYLMGYARLGLSQEPLYGSLIAYAKQVVAACSVFVLLSALISLVAVRRITAPLGRVVQLAHDVSNGRLSSIGKLQGSDEVREIASLLNYIVQSLNSYKTKLDVNNQLLTMKVEERTKQLSERNDQLRLAMEEATIARERLRRLAYFDSLTVLPNRQFFTEQLKLMLSMAKRDGHQLALLFIDLDNFKRINDSLGHSAGDSLLKEVAKRLNSCIRESDLISRYIDSSLEIGVSRLGGDEFTVVLSRIENAAIVGKIAQRLLNTLTRPMVIEGHELVITPSIGIALSPDDGEDIEGLLKHADTAMYHAKNNGKNSFQYYSSSMNEMGVQRLKLETDLRRALKNHELVLHYQPQVDISTGRICGAEAMVRWIHPEHGLVPPLNFITLAEEMGLIVELGDWVLREACRQTKQWQMRGLHIPKIAVNISSLQFEDEGFMGRVREELKATGLAPGALKLELTESVIMKNADTAVEALVALQNMGVQLAVDDFGTGYSSLNYLSQFPLHELKIDRSFVIDIEKENHNEGLIVAIIAMARSLNLNLVAEGVETKSQYLFLKDKGVEVIQGFLFSGPVPPAEFEKMLAHHQFDQVIAQQEQEAKSAPGVAGARLWA